MRRKYTTVIVAHHTRLDKATALQKEVKGLLSIDKENIGSTQVHINALKVAQEVGRPYAFILEDDAVVCNSVSATVKKVINDNPQGLTSLYLGTQRPPQWQAEVERKLTEKFGTAQTTHPNITHPPFGGLPSYKPFEGQPSYITLPTLIHGVGYVIALENIDSILVLMKRYEAYGADMALGRAFIEVNGGEVAYFVPSCVNHVDNGSVEKHHDGVVREAGRFARIYCNESDQILNQLNEDVNTMESVEEVSSDNGIRGGGYPQSEMLLSSTALSTFKNIEIGQGGVSHKKHKSPSKMETIEYDKVTNEVIEYTLSLFKRRYSRVTLDWTDLQSEALYWWALRYDNLYRQFGKVDEPMFRAYVKTSVSKVLQRTIRQAMIEYHNDLSRQHPSLWGIERLRVELYRNNPAVWEAAKNLKSKQYEALVLVFKEGLSKAEAGEKLGIKTGTFFSRYTLALENLLVTYGFKVNDEILFCLYNG